MHPDEETQLYADIATQYSPEWWNRDTGWIGQTYLEALQFCGENDGRELCTLEAICPLGQDSEPLGGYREEPNGSWVPILDESNEWVQVSSDADLGGPCIRYDHEHQDPTPRWGLTGEGDEEMTRHVACCLVQGTPVTVITPANVATTVASVETVTEEAPIGFDARDEKYLIMAQKYRPEWHDRERDWLGQTYLEAVEFCAEKEGYEICPFEAICPLGPDTEPLGGYREDPNGSWVPTIDSPNDWVQVSAKGAGGTCKHYINEHAEAPHWGVTGEDNEDITRQVVCCLVQGTADMLIPESATPPPAAVAMTTATSTEVEASDNNEDGVSEEHMSMVYQTVSETYEPKWFDRSKGWHGQTHNEAFLFCADFNGYFPCPYEAICPLGKGSQPLGGNKNDSNGSWAPIMDGPNQWVQLSEDASCVQWSHLHPGPPEWGETGEDNEDLTRHIACCLDISTTPDPTPKPTAMPTPQPTEEPSLTPTPQPTPEPTPEPTNLPTHTPIRAPTPEPTMSDADYYKAIVTSLEPIWFHRTNGWEGKTYLEALQFCASQESRIPCPYIAYCPIGTFSHPLGGVQEGVSWAPIIDGPNAWVQVGEEDMCQLYTELYKSPPQWGLTGKSSEDLTRHVMCCLEEPLEEAEEPPEEVPGEMTSFTETEQAVLDVFKPEWYGRGEGYQGTTYLESAQFCYNVAGMDLCPLEAYCPNGPATEAGAKPLFLQLDAFEGEQWAPVKTDVDDEDDIYVLIGTISDNPVTTCHTYRHFHSGEMPQWGLDGSNPELKNFVLCCKDPNYISTGISNPVVDLSTGGPEISNQELDDEHFDVEIAIKNDLEPEWLGFSDGWLGESHSDAEDFCDSRGNKQICPYAAYCPHGPGQPVSKGHSTDINAEGVQWSPVFGHENHWVMVGQKHGNSATTCFGHEDLEGRPPSWGLTSEQHEIKRHIMCCKL